MTHALPLPRRVLAALVLTLLLPGCDEADRIVVPTLYLIGGQVADPTVSPVRPLAGVRVSVVTAPEVAPAVTDADGVFLLHGVPPGVHRLRAEIAGHRTTVTIGIPVEGNVDNAGIPLFTDVQIDSVLASHGAPAWDRGSALLGVFALRSNGLALGSATITLSPGPPHAGGTLVQTGQAEDPIVIVNAAVGSYQLAVSHPGFDWDDPYPTRLDAGVLTFGVPRARPNLTGYLFSSRTTGPPVEGASVQVWEGPTPGSSGTDFLGQFSLPALVPAMYILRIQAPGYVTGLTWPQEIVEDTTLTCAVVPPDTLAAWSAAQGGPAPDPIRGHVAVEARAAAGGAVLIGALLSADNAEEGVALPQTAGAPALLVNLPPGRYTIRISGPGISGESVSRGVVVLAGEITFSRLDL